jgi:hypothetical protein
MPKASAISLYVIEGLAAISLSTSFCLLVRASVASITPPFTLPITPP